MKYKVYHTNKPTFGFGARAKFPQEYTQVALVECIDIEDAFRATNTIDDIWIKNPEVIELYQTSCRSTSVGDVLVDEDGNAMYCAPCGWDDIEVAEVVAERSV